MKYYRIRTDWDSKTTGRRNGGALLNRIKILSQIKEWRKILKNFL